ncbi:Co-chaperone protein HscB [Buchnera aphidicola (Eriosoma lanigerum)]|uniref:Fe-S protein assembly co-chaperone HscB n=1 Tax=Buchnera aphidicola TaxID=9 RepID=UPI003464CA0B
MNYFNLFGLSEKFQIDNELLLKNFYSLQKKFHPDLFICSSLQKKQEALQKSILINNAFHILQDPYLRAEYLLNLNHIDINHNKFSLNKNTFLKKYLQLYEEFYSITNNNDFIQQLEYFNKNKIIKKIEKYTQKIEHELNNQEWNKATYTIQKIHFFLKLKKNVEQQIEKNNIH